MSINSLCIYPWINTIFKYLLPSGRKLQTWYRKCLFPLCVLLLLSTLELPLPDVDMLLLKTTVSLLYTRLWIICFPTRRTLCVGGLLAFQGLCRVWEAGSYCKQSNRREWEQGGAYISLIILRRQVPRSSELRCSTENLNRPSCFQGSCMYLLNAKIHKLT